MTRHVLQVILVSSLFIPIFMVGCTSTKGPEFIDGLLPRSVLRGQVLRLRRGHEGKLTNAICNKGTLEKCEAFDVKEYDLADESVRKALIDLHFRCDVGGKRYRICGSFAGFCRREDDIVKRFLFIPVKRTIVIKSFDAVKDFEFLLNAKTECRVGSSFSD